MSPTSAPGIAQPLARYAAWRRAGDFIYLSGIIAMDPAASRIVRGYADIPDEAATLIGRTGEFSSDIKEGPILAQSWYLLDRIRQTIEAAGSQMSDVFKLVQYFKSPTGKNCAGCPAPTAAPRWVGCLAAALAAQAPSTTARWPRPATCWPCAR